MGKSLTDQPRGTFGDLAQFGAAGAFPEDGETPQKLLKGDGTESPLSFTETKIFVGGVQVETAIGSQEKANAAQAASSRSIEIKTSSFTAVNGGNYQVEGVVTIADPAGSNVLGASYEVSIGSGSATMGGVTYSPSAITRRRRCSVAGTPGTWVTPIVSLSDPFNAAAGSVSAPSFTFTGDTNTGMWSPGADTLAWSTGGVERMRVNSVGDVGIGVTPTAKLHIGGVQTTNSTVIANGVRLDSTNTVQQNGFQNGASFSPQGASLTSLFGLINLTNLTLSAAPVTTVNAIFSRIDTTATYTGQIINGNCFVAGTANLLGPNPITNYRGFQVDGFSNGNGRTSGTTNNTGVSVDAFTAGAGSGGTINNYGGVFNVPTGSGAGTTNNYGLLITGNGGGSFHRSLANNSTSLSYFIGSLGVGTASPAVRLHVINTVEQMRIGFDASNYYSTTVSAAGGVTFDAVGTAPAFTFSDITNFSLPPITPTYTVGTVPSASIYARGIIYVSNQSGGATIAFSDGTNWRKISDRAIIS